jgi:hypothetical protein
MLGLFYGLIEPYRIGAPMTEHSPQRITADRNFLKVQTQSLARDRILSEAETVTRAREVNMARQRQQRLEKGEADRQAALASPSKKKRKRPA